MASDSNEQTCHVCEENKTDFACHICGEPVCEDCCVVPTYHNQLDYAFCTVCESGREERRWRDAEIEEKHEAAIAAKKKAIADKRLTTRMKPENIAKRIAAKTERKKLRVEQARIRMEQTVKLMAEIFKGFF